MGETVPSASLHERTCIIDENGIAHVRVHLENLCANGKDVVLATLSPPYCAYTAAPRAYDSKGQREVMVETAGRSSKKVRFVLKCAPDARIDRLDWEFRVSSAIPFIRADGILTADEYWQRGRSPGYLLARSHVLCIKSDLLRLRVQIDGNEPAFADGRVLVERRTMPLGGLEHAWDRVAAKARLAIDPGGTRAELEIHDAEIDQRYGIEFQPQRGGSLDGRDTALAVTDRVLGLCRSERKDADPFLSALTRSLASGIKESLGGSLEQVNAIGLLWNRGAYALQPAYGHFPYAHWSLEYRFGCGVAGHAFRFCRPAVYYKSRSHDVSLLHDRRASTDLDWEICLPLTTGPAGVPVGVVGFSGEEGCADLERELCGIAKHPTADGSQRSLRNLYWLVNVAFWRQLSLSRSISGEDSRYADSVLSRFPAAKSARATRAPMQAPHTGHVELKVANRTLIGVVIAALIGAIATVVGGYLQRDPGTRTALGSLEEAPIESAAVLGWADEGSSGMRTFKTEREKGRKVSPLRKLDLSNAKKPLTAAPFFGLDLTGANFTGVDLTRADFQGADLAQAIFDRAILSGANLSGARHLTQEQLAPACRDAETKLDRPLTAPQCGNTATP